MDDMKRFAEYGDMDGLSYSMLESLKAGVRSQEEVLIDFLTRFKRGIIQSLKQRKLIDQKVPAMATFSELLNEIENTNDDYEQFHIRAYETIHTCVKFESAIELKSWAEAILYALKLGEELTYKPTTHSRDKISWSEFEPLSGSWPEIEDMTPSSDAGRLVKIIERAREIWGNDPAPPPWKIDQVNRLKRSKSRVFQKAERYGNSWKDTNISPENPMYYLYSQIETEMILKFSREASGMDDELDSRITDSEVYALYAIIFAFNGLNELWKQEYLGEIAQDRYINLYTAEAEGFIRHSIEMLSKSFSNRQSEAAKNRHKWGPIINEWLEREVVKSSAKKSNRALARALLPKAMEKRYDADKTRWTDEFQALENLAKRIGKIKKNLL